MSRTTAACRVAIAEQAQSFVFLLKGTNRTEEICSLVTSSNRTCRDLLREDRL